MKVVFDTNTVISALLFRRKLSVLVENWQQLETIPLICEQTHAEFLRVLAYPKFKLNVTQIEILAARYLSYTKMVTISKHNVNNLPKCRDDQDQIFLELAFIGQADFLVSGDDDLLILKSKTPFEIITPMDYLMRDELRTK